ncbi:MAG TPA: membrane dipeptidase [Salinarimonas sp.]|nr:membrane dipeptidase [Salinarimonas sp.]
MRLRWAAILSGAADTFDGRTVEIAGWPLAASEAARGFMLLPEPPCCGGCPPADPRGAVEVEGTTPYPGACLLRGIWRCRRGDPEGWRYRLEGAVALTGERPSLRVTRRGLLAGAPLLCLGAPLAAQGPEAASSAPLPPEGGVDLHGHGGAILRVRRETGTQAPFAPLAGPMREARLSVAVLAIVPDSLLNRLTPEGRIAPARDPAPGELRAFAEAAFGRVHALAREQGLPVLRTAAELDAARPDQPSILVASEGGDFLEGEVGALDAAFAIHALRSLQLTHFRVNELGDVQTAAPVHGGLTAFGAEVVRRCEALGIIVDVAHGTEALVRRAVDVARKPLILSHAAIARGPRARSRLITADHARLVASTGGVVGLWPHGEVFADLAALAEGTARLADAVGPAHVALATDLGGIIGRSVVPEYAVLPAFATELRRRFSADEVAGILGGNARRVARACLP